MKKTILSITHFRLGERLLIQGVRRPAPYGRGPNFAVLIGVAASAGFWCVLAAEISRVLR
jgi:hypothetical protein